MQEDGGTRSTPCRTNRSPPGLLQMRIKDIIPAHMTLVTQHFLVVYQQFAGGALGGIAWV